MDKKRPFHHTLISDGLGFVEKEYPQFSRLLRYHSLIDRPSEAPMAQTIIREARWFDPDYVDSFRAIAYPGEVEVLDLTRPEPVPVSVLQTDDYEIYGHIKAAIRPSNGHVWSFSPLQRLTLTDAYPLPWYRERKLEGGVIFVPNLENYFHLLMDHVLPPFAALVRNRETYSHVSFVMQRNFPLIDLFASILNDLGIATSIVSLGKFDRVRGGTLIIGSAIPRDSGSVFMYRDELEAVGNLIDERVKSFETPKRFFVKRTGTPRRHLKNEAELIEFLEKRGVSAVELSFKNPLDQVALFRNAELIISVHGAALANLIWAKRARIIELFPETSRPKHYIHIAAQMGLDYQPIIGSPGDKRDSFELNPSDFEKLKI